MKLRPLFLVLGCLGLLAFSTGCPSNDDEPRQPVGFHPVRRNPTPLPTQLPPDQVDPALVDATPTPRPSRQQREEAGGGVPASAPAGDYPYGVPVPGKPGYVTSPYAPDAGYVDVRDFATGQEARCPYTQKIFLVP